MSSTANNPDLDWSQVRETINMLTLAVAQIECTMSEGDNSVAELTQSFTYIASQLQEISNQSSEKRDDGNENNDALQTLQFNASDIHQQVVSAIINFQFYDRLSQRLNHVKRDLNWLSELVSTPEQLYNPNSWKKLQADIASNYSMEEERIMFEHIMSGTPVDQALEVYRHHFSKAKEDASDNNHDDEVELF